jgi:hypothetical protein
MTPGTHSLVGWWTANVVPLPRRDRFLVFLGGVLPDLDGLGLLYSKEAYFTYHHVLCHNLFACLAWTLLAGLTARQRTICATLSFLNWHLHLACVYFGSRGPPPSEPWVLPYLFPLVGSWHGTEFAGPSWYWNRWQWELNAWPNLVVTLLGIVGWFYLAVRLDRSWIEFVSPRLDARFCRRLRERLGVTGPVGFTNLEAAVIRRSYLVVTIGAFLACVVAAAGS